MYMFLRPTKSDSAPAQTTQRKPMKVWVITAIKTKLRDCPNTVVALWVIAG
jgi:hypothetical protein